MQKQKEMETKLKASNDLVLKATAETQAAEKQQKDVKSASEKQAADSRIELAEKKEKEAGTKQKAAAKAAELEEKIAKSKTQADKCQVSKRELESAAEKEQKRENADAQKENAAKVTHAGCQVLKDKANDHSVKSWHALICFCFQVNTTQLSFPSNAIVGAAQMLVMGTSIQVSIGSQMHVELVMCLTRRIEYAFCTVLLTFSSWMGTG